MRQYQPHEQRVIDEANLLRDEVKKLSNFISGAFFRDVPEKEGNLLIAQLSVMNAYLSILSMRIDGFTSKDNKTLTEVIRNAYVECTIRDNVFDYISHYAEVDRPTAKRLAFAYLYFPTEETLQGIANTKGMLPPDLQGKLDTAMKNQE